MFEIFGSNKWEWAFAENPFAGTQFVRTPKFQLFVAKQLAATFKPLAALLLTTGHLQRVI